MRESLMQLAIDQPFGKGVPLFPRQRELTSNEDTAVHDGDIVIEAPELTPPDTAQTAEMALSPIGESRLYLAGLAISNAAASVKERVTEAKDKVIGFTKEVAQDGRKKVKAFGALALTALGVGTFEATSALATPAREARIAQTPPTPAPEAGTSQTPDEDYTVAMKDCAKLAVSSLKKTKAEYADKKHKYIKLSISMGALPEDCQVDRKVTSEVRADYSREVGSSRSLWGNITKLEQFTVWRRDNKAFTLTKKVRVTGEDVCLPGKTNRKTRQFVMIYGLDKNGKTIVTPKDYTKRGVTNPC